MKQSLGEQCNQLLQEVKFGVIDGMYDLDLEEYFIDRDYFEGLFCNRKKGNRKFVRSLEV